MYTVRYELETVAEMYEYFNEMTISVRVEQKFPHPMKGPFKTN